ncbi:MAG: NUDIX domain-containing protein [Acidimicrobiia bacterium]|nr:NUDIX domain-containing protein [Acidimicrobiia bacterium]MDH4309809.1 NUDIX domain-containing protein [Acidimicrobiia bacterium]MDH5521863.1 NUDIX domain-containing protein [Acidimicrobiia bacterium]
MATSAGLLPFRFRPHPEVLIAHPGGPMWARRDAGSWSIVKGLVEDGEDLVEAARREFEEETGWTPPAPSSWIALGHVTLKSGKRVWGWAVEWDVDPTTLTPGTFEMVWRGTVGTFPEIDRVAWVDHETARLKLNPAQTELVDRLVDTDYRGVDVGFR